jgi:acyl-CoA synthetase (AMP-forming)/AMP-acid ligase II
VRAIEKPPQSRAASPVEVTSPHESLVCAIESAAKSGAPFFTLHGAKGEVARTPAQALDAAWRWAKLFASRGVGRGDRVPILLPTSHAFVEAMLGAMLCGAVPVPLATPMTFGSVDRYVENLGAIVEDCGARVVVAHGRVREAIAKSDALRASLGDVLGEGDLEGVGSLRFVAPSLSSRDTAFLQYTSGTTGRPKGAVISQRALVSNAFAIAHGLGLGDAHVGVSWLPLFHDMGLIGVLLTSICHPYPLHVMSPESFVMNPRRWLELIAKVGGTLSAAPNFAYDLCVARGGELEEARLDTWRIALNGAEPVHKTTIARFHDRYARHGLRADAMMPVYGMAEATLAVTFPSLDAKLETEGDAVSVGRPVAGMRVEIADGDGNVAPEGAIGEIRVAGPSLMDGYFRDDAKSAEAIRGGWLHTGDLGFMNGGRLFVSGRAKEIIIKAGRNLHPHDIERVAAEVSGVRAGGVAAFGRANAESGTEDVIVVVETTSGDAEKREAIAKGVRAELLSVLGVKADDVRVCAVGAIPRTTSGKIRRRECARRLEDGALG